MALNIEIYRRRRCIFTFTITDVNDDLVTLQAGDVVRVKIGRAGATPVLDLESTGPTANGSTVTFANPSTVTLDADDVTLLAPGIWDMEGALYQSAQGETLHAIEGTLTVYDTMLGDISGV